jgi:hypothetical protein
MVQVDAIHRGAVTDRLIKEEDLLIGVLLRQSRDKV